MHNAFILLLVLLLLAGCAVPTAALPTTPSPAAVQQTFAPSTATPRSVPTTTVAALVPSLTAATRLELRAGRSGVGRSMPQSQSVSFDLQTLPSDSIVAMTIGGNQQSSQTFSVPTKLTAAQLTRALDLLSTLPLAPGRYDPPVLYADGDAALVIVVWIGEERIVFETTAQSEQHLPWRAMLGNTSYTITDVRIYQAWEVLAPALQPDAFSKAVQQYEQR